MTAIFIEPSLLKKNEIKIAVDGTGYPAFPLESIADVKKVENDVRGQGQLAEMYLLFIIDDFESDLFKTVRKRFKRREPKATIIGPPYLLELAANKENGFRFNIGKHIFNNVFKNQSVVIGGQPKDLYDSAIIRAKFLGAMARDEISTKVDFLFTTNLCSKKFSQATKFDIPVVKRQIIFDMWDRRMDITLRLTKEMIDKYQYRPFEKLKMKFQGFNGDQLFQLEEELLNNGGEVWTEGETDGKISAASVLLVPNDLPKPDMMTIEDLNNVVMEEWFWSCIQVCHHLTKRFELFIFQMFHISNSLF